MLLAIIFSFGSVSQAADGAWIATGATTVPRYVHTASLLPNGKVLVAGGYTAEASSLASAELYDPATGVWTATGAMTAPRSGHTATLLPNGKVLVAGGADTPTNDDVSPFLATAELYDPATGVWTATGAMTNPRYFHTATLLPNGQVLVAGGFGNSGPLASAELYDPATGVWTATGAMTAPRYGHTATLLPNGKVLVTGLPDRPTVASAELYDPATGAWAATGAMIAPRQGHTASLLPNGKVLAAGGDNSSGFLASGELYDLATGVWTTTGAMTAKRDAHTASLLPNGQVLVAGGYAYGYGDSGFLASAELYDPATGLWTATGSMTTPRYGQTASLLPNGQVLAAGGDGNIGGGTGAPLASAELYGTFSVLTSGSNCNGFYTGTFNGNVNVTNGQDCVWVNATINGNAQQNGGNLVIDQTTVKGNVQVTGGGTFAIGPSSAINGNLQIQSIPVGTAQNQVCGTTVTGNLQFHNNGTAVQIGSASSSCAGNTIGGNLQVDNNTGSTAIFNNTVAGNLQDQDNVGSTQVVNNTITHNLQCGGNTLITGGGNTASQKQGQCAAF